MANNIIFMIRIQKKIRLLLANTLNVEYSLFYGINSEGLLGTKKPFPYDLLYEYVFLIP